MACGIIRFVLLICHVRIGGELKRRGFQSQSRRLFDTEH